MALARFNSAEEWARGAGAARSSALTVGNFDGVHLGHQAILRRVVGCARGMDARAAVLTFYPHPARVLRGEDQAPRLIETLEQRLAGFERMGVEAALVLRFDAELARVEAEEFVRRFLVATMRARSVLVGENFRFGHQGRGDVALLRQLGRESQFQVECIEPVRERGEIISSSGIRLAVGEGRVEDAARMLGRPFVLAGEIKTGTGMGRKLVVPTLNLATVQELLPKRGVYATEALVGGREYRAATNVGMRPTFDGAALAIESHLIGFSETLTTGSMEVRFLRRLRDERKFSGPEELREQILKDVERAAKES